MEYYIFDLKTNVDKDNYIEGEIDFSSKIKDDILDLSKCLVDGTFLYDSRRDGWIFNLHLQISVTKACAYTLEPVNFLVDFDTDLIYTFKVTDDDAFPIQGNKIVLDEEIWGEIFMNIPSRVIKEGAVFDDSENVYFDDDNPFANLKLEDDNN